MNLYINPNLTPRGSLVISQTNPTAVPVRDFVFDNVLNTNIYLVNGIGDFDDNSGNSDYSLRVGIGEPGESPAWVNTNWTSSGDGWNGTIATNTTAIEALFTSQASNPINVELEITITDSDGNDVTDLSVPIKIYNRVAATSDLVAPPSVNDADGEFSIPNGVDTVLVTGLALSAAPARVVVSIRKAAGADNIFGMVVSSTITTDGFRVDLSALTTVSTYKVDYLLIY